MVKSIREAGPNFTFDEYNVMLRLIHDLNPNQEDEETNESKSDNSLSYSEWFRKLDGAMADFEN